MLILINMAQLRFWYALLISFFVIGIFFSVNYSFEAVNRPVVQAAPLTPEEIEEGRQLIIDISSYFYVYKDSANKPFTEYRVYSMIKRLKEIFKTEAGYNEWLSNFNASFPDRPPVGDLISTFINKYEQAQVAKLIGKLFPNSNYFGCFNGVNGNSKDYKTLMKLGNELYDAQQELEGLEAYIQRARNNSSFTISEDVLIEGETTEAIAKAEKRIAVLRKIITDFETRIKDILYKSFFSSPTSTCGIKPILPPTTPTNTLECYKIKPNNLGPVAQFTEDFAKTFPKITLTGQLAAKIAVIGAIIGGVTDYAIDGDAEKGKREVEAAIMLCDSIRKSPNQKDPPCNSALLIANACNAKAYQGLQYANPLELIRLGGDLINYLADKPTSSTRNFNDNLAEIRKMKDDPAYKECKYLADFLSTDPNYQAYVDEVGGKLFKDCKDILAEKIAEAKDLNKETNNKLKATNDYLANPGNNAYNDLTAIKPVDLSSVFPPLCSYSEFSSDNECVEQRQNTDEAFRDYARSVPAAKYNQVVSDLQGLRSVYEGLARDYFSSLKKLGKLIDEIEKLQLSCSKK